MAAERVEQLKSILAQDPGNTFARYALGMEYMSAGETGPALQEVLALHPAEEVEAGQEMAAPRPPHLAGVESIGVPDGIGGACGGHSTYTVARHPQDLASPPRMEIEIGLHIAWAERLDVNPVGSKLQPG